MELQFDADEPVRLDQRLRFVRFAGEAKTFGRLLGGAVRDLNVIVRRDSVRAEVLHRPLVGPMVFLPEAATTWFVYLVAGQAALKDADGIQLGAGESLLLEPDDVARTRVVSGGGEVVLIKLTRLPV
jgi:environmental stress-induced protein Ves